MVKAVQPSDLSDSTLARAVAVLGRARDHDLSVVTAESCTGGLLASLLTDIEGYSSTFERGFVVYSNAAKHQLLGIDAGLIDDKGAVSREVAVAMAEGALSRSQGDLGVAITGFAGPAGDDDEEGLVHLAARSRRGDALHRECHFGTAGRDKVREDATYAALEMLDELLDRYDSDD